MAPPTAASTPAQLTRLFADLGAGISRARTTTAALTVLTATAVDAVTGVDFASISRDRGDHYQTLAPTDPAATGADQLQYDLGDGPCLTAVTADTVVRTGDVRTDPRWPVYGARTFAEYGVLSMLSIHLALDDDAITSSLNLYSRTPDAFDDHAATTATLIAVYGAAAVRRLIAHEDAAHLAIALTNARTIGIATGILMTQQRLTAAQAFELLRTTSQHTNRKLAHIADMVTHTGALPPPQ